MRAEVTTMAGENLVLRGRDRDLGGGVTVRRLLPASARRAVGPFIFLDHFGPVQLPPGQGLDVRPHPHINLATVTYLFEGEIMHRDSLGSALPIRPGAINWMTAGRGIVHSERSPAAERAAGARMHGLQLWVGLPTAHEEVEPSFHHQPAATLPEVELPGARLRVLAGAAYGVTSPVPVLSSLFYVEASLEAGAELALPDDYGDRAAYVVEGALRCDGEEHGAGTLLVLGARSSGRLAATAAARIMLLGGAPLDGERHIWWNFASSSAERIEKAKEDWRHGRFARVPGDEIEFIPLP
jgi:redox-sensitive bicupin YhaK (pirin superfamily)